MLRKTKAEIRIEIVKIVLLTLTAILMLSPFVWMISVSLERYANIQPPFPPRMIPEEFSFFNYKIVMENGTLLKAYLSSFIVAASTVLIATVSALMAGYAFSKGKFPGKKILFLAVLATMMLPFEATMIPMFLMFVKVGMVNTYWPLVLPRLLYGFGVILSKQYFDNLPDSLREAARIDGAGEIRIFNMIFIPLSGPMIATQVILLFMFSWNDFLWPLIVLTSHKLQTVPIYLSKFSHHDGTNLAGLSMALSGASIIPVIIVFLFFQNYIIQSVALSGIKGE
jgi:multiple sugar transport system permease protein